MKDVMMIAIKGIGILAGVRMVHGIVMGVVGEEPCHQHGQKEGEELVVHCPHHHVLHDEYSAKELLEDMAYGASNVLNHLATPPASAGSWGEYLANRSNDNQHRIR